MANRKLEDQDDAALNGQELLESIMEFIASYPDRQVTYTVTGPKEFVEKMNEFLAGVDESFRNKIRFIEKP